jgi:hypothetical protein
MKIKTKLILLFAISNVACAHQQIIIHSFHATSDRFTYFRKELEVNIPLSPSMGGWNVNCERTRAIVWGRAWDQIKVGDTPLSRIYLIDLEGDKVIGEFTVTRGPFEVFFGRDRRRAAIDDNVIDLPSGKMIGMTEDINVTPESCPPFPGKKSD